MHRVRISSDGTGAGTTVVDDETGEPIRVTRVSYEVSMSELGMARLDVAMPKVDVVGDVEVTECCPYCGRRKAES